MTEGWQGWVPEWTAGTVLAEDTTGQIAAAVRSYEDLLRHNLDTGRTYVITPTNDENRVHRPSCASVAHWMTGENALEQAVRGIGGPVDSVADAIDRGYLPRLTPPRMLTRDEAEALPKYVRCRVCSPDLLHGKKTAHQEDRNTKKAAGLGRRDVGRRVWIDGSWSSPIVAISARHDADDSTITAHLEDGYVHEVSADTVLTLSLPANPLKLP